jgi:hypothetical protein
MLWCQVGDGGYRLDFGLLNNSSRSVMAVIIGQEDIHSRFISSKVLSSSQVSSNKVSDID